MSSSQSTDRPQRRGLGAASIAVLGAVALCAVNSGWISLTGKPSRDLLIVIAVWELIFYVWVRVASKWSLTRQTLALLVFIGAQAVFYLSVRLDGFAGDGSLILVWRWTPTAEQLFNASRIDRSPILLQEQTVTPRSASWDVPAFRGELRDGAMPAEQLDPNWSDHPPNELWRIRVGRGWSSFATAGELCFTQEQRGTQEAVVAYQLHSGQEVWVHQDAARFDEPTGGSGPRATPTCCNQRIYSLGATGLLNCFNANSGRSIWQVNVLRQHDVENCLFGMAGSPLIVDSTVVVAPGGMGCSLAAYDLVSGELCWKAGDAASSYSSPHLAKLAGQQQILNFNAEGLFAHDASDGTVLWSHAWVSNPAERNNVGQPVVVPRKDSTHAPQVLIASGYGKGCALLEITGPHNPQTIATKWQNRNLKAKFSSVVYVDGHVYGFDGAVLCCVDVATGQRKWKRGHYGYGQLVVAAGHLLVQLENGEIALVEATPEAHRELARFRVFTERTWSHPVVSGDLLLVRNDREAACFRLPLVRNSPTTD